MKLRKKISFIAQKCYLIARRQLDIDKAIKVHVNSLDFHRQRSYHLFDWMVLLIATVLVLDAGSLVFFFPPHARHTGTELVFINILFN